MCGGTVGAASTRTPGRSSAAPPPSARRATAPPPPPRWGEGATFSRCPTRKGLHLKPHSAYLYFLKIQGSSISWLKGSVCFVLKFALPPFSPPLSSVMQFFKQNMHGTFDPRNNLIPVHYWRNISLEYFCTFWHRV